MIGIALGLLDAANIEYNLQKKLDLHLYFSQKPGKLVL